MVLLDWIEDSDGIDENDGSVKPKKKEGTRGGDRITRKYGYGFVLHA